MTERQIFSIVQIQAEKKETEIKFNAALHGRELKDPIKPTKFTTQEDDALKKAMAKKLARYKPEEKAS